MATGVAAGVGSGVGFGVAAGSGVTDGLGVGFGVGRGVGLGVGAGAQPRTPLPSTLPEDSGVSYFAGGSVPLGGKRASDNARISGTSGIWMDPRLS